MKKNATYSTTLKQDINAGLRESMKNHVPSDEEMYEMRAAFGPGQKIVNVVTGQEYTT
jgi:hypothetical protein